MTVLRAKLSRWMHWPTPDNTRRAPRVFTYNSSPLLRYIVSLATLVLATTIRWALDSELGAAQAYTFYFAAIAITSWYAGFWPSVVAICLSYFAAHWFFIHPRYQFNFHEYSVDDYLSLGAFLFSSFAISFTSLALHAARKRSELKQQQLAREIAERERTRLELQKAQAQLQEHAHMLEQRVEERTANLVQTIQSLEGVCYHIAHDLRAPLRSVQGFTTLLLEEYAPHLDRTGKDYARRAAESANRMDSLIFSLLEYGQLGHVQFPFTSVDLGKIVTAIVNQHEARIQLRNAQIQIDHPLPTIHGNAELLEQVLDNLISNALKFVRPDTTPRIHVWAQKTDTTAKLWIEDNGIGIKPEYQKKVFQIFEQLYGNQKYPGTGIGLALVAKAVQKMNGRVGVESEFGKGSRFWVELPLPP
jgi:signal transduction histidine kinase